LMKKQAPKKVLAIDIGGTSVKVLASGETEPRKGPVRSHAHADEDGERREAPHERMELQGRVHRLPRHRRPFGSRILP
jgi:hypothetical protein